MNVKKNVEKSKKQQKKQTLYEKVMNSNLNAVCGPLTPTVSQPSSEEYFPGTLDFDSRRRKSSLKANFAVPCRNTRITSKANDSPLPRKATKHRHNESATQAIIAKTGACSKSEIESESVSARETNSDSDGNKSDVVTTSKDLEAEDAEMSLDEMGFEFSSNKNSSQNNSRTRIFRDFDINNNNNNNNNNSNYDENNNNYTNNNSVDQLPHESDYDYLKRVGADFTQDSDEDNNNNQKNSSNSKIKNSLNLPPNSPITMQESFLMPQKNKSKAKSKSSQSEAKEDISELQNILMKMNDELRVDLGFPLQFELRLSELIELGEQSIQTVFSNLLFASTSPSDVLTNMRDAWEIVLNASKRQAFDYVNKMISDNSQLHLFRQDSDTYELVQICLCWLKYHTVSNYSDAKSSMQSLLITIENPEKKQLLYLIDYVENVLKARIGEYSRRESGAILETKKMELIHKKKKKSKNKSKKRAKADKKTSKQSTSTKSTTKAVSGAKKDGKKGTTKKNASAHKHKHRHKHHSKSKKHSKHNSNNSNVSETITQLNISNDSNKNNEAETINNDSSDNNNLDLQTNDSNENNEAEASNNDNDSSNNNNLDLEMPPPQFPPRQFPPSIQPIAPIGPVVPAFASVPARQRHPSQQTTAQQ